MRVRLETYAFAKNRGRAGGTRGWARPLGPGWAPGCFPDRRSRGLGGVGEVVQASAGPAARPVTAPPGRSAAADCPSLPQRPVPSRSAREETLIFRASARRRSRPRAPLWQIWTRPRPGAPQEPHQHHTHAHPSLSPRRPGPTDHCSQRERLTIPDRPPRAPPLTHSLPHHRVDPWLWAAGSGEIDLNASSARQNPPQLAQCELSSTKST